jgi:NitT/TauT family transport system substrate-binding protein
MAAAEAFGEQSWDKREPLTVTTRDAAAVGILKSGTGEVTSHFTYDPYRAAYQGDAKVRPILQSRDVLGGVGTVALTYTTTRFHDANPKMVAAYFAALAEADDIIKRDPARAARIFKAASKSSQSDAEMEALIRQPDSQYSVTPVSIGKFATFMARNGTIKQAPATWRDLFFPEAKDLAGS